MKVSVIASVAVQLLRDGRRVVISAGEPLPDLSAAEERDLVAAGALDIEKLKASISSQVDETRAGAGSPGTNTSAGGAGEPLPELPAEAYAPDAAPLDTSPARPDEPVPELARETQPVAAPARKPRSK